MSWEPETRPKRVPEAAFRDYDGEAVVVLPHGAVIHVLNPQGRLVFDLLDGNHSVTEITEALMAEYEVDQEQAGQDLVAFLDELQANDMLA